MCLRPIDAFIIPLSFLQKNIGNHNLTHRTPHKTDIHNGIVTSYLKILHSIFASNNNLLSTVVRHCYGQCWIGLANSAKYYADTDIIKHRTYTREL